MYIKINQLAKGLHEVLIIKESEDLGSSVKEAALVLCKEFNGFDLSCGLGDYQFYTKDWAPELDKERAEKLAKKFKGKLQ